MKVTYINEKTLQKFEIVADEDPPSPREDPEIRVGTFVGYPDNTYNFGDENIRDAVLDPNDCGEAMNDRITETIAAGGRAYPVQCYEHSGIALHLGEGPGASDPGGWDTRPAGWFFVTPADMKKIGRKMEDVEDILKTELQQLTCWMNGWAWRVVEWTGENGGADGGIEWTDTLCCPAAYLSLGPEDDPVAQDFGIPADPEKAAAAGWRRIESC